MTLTTQTTNPNVLNISKSSSHNQTATKNDPSIIIKPSSYNESVGTNKSIENENNVINLKGSIDIVSDFFFTAINSILYQRGIYLPETFKRECKYGITVLTTTDAILLQYLQQVQHQVTKWLSSKQIQRLVLVIKGVDTLETLERWQFNVTVTDENAENVTPVNSHVSNGTTAATTKDVTGSNSTMKKFGGKSMKEIHNEIQAIIRQITASVTFLPLLNEPCTFDLLVYTNKNVTLSDDNQWVDSDPCYISSDDATQVKLRSFTTSIHTIDSMVTYKNSTSNEWDL